jgi:hypothetical protein
MMDEGIAVKVDLIIGLPGDTVASVRRGLHYLHDSRLCSDLQVFNLSILPGTAFRHEAAELGLVFQPRPPYYVLQTPTLDRTDLFGLMQEAQELFGLEFDAQPPPLLDFGEAERERAWRVDLDRPDQGAASPAQRRMQAFTLWLRSACFARRGPEIPRIIAEVLEANPFTTLQVVLEPTEEWTAAAIRRQLGTPLLEELLAACHVRPTYLDKYYGLQPGRPNGAKRLIVLLPAELRAELGDWVEEVGSSATLVWRCAAGDHLPEEEFEVFEYAWTPRGDSLHGSLHRTAG